MLALLGKGRVVFWRGVLGPHQVAGGSLMV